MYEVLCEKNRNYPGRQGYPISDFENACEYNFGAGVDPAVPESLYDVGSIKGDLVIMSMSKKVQNRLTTSMPQKGTKAIKLVVFVFVSCSEV